MSEMSVIETQHYVGGGSSNTEHHCKDCGLNFESETSLEIHLRYHHDKLLNQWANKAQQEESNNNHSKAGNHNSHAGANRDSIVVDSCESSSMSPSQDPAASQQQPPQQQQQQQQQQQPPPQQQPQPQQQQQAQPSQQQTQQQPQPQQQPNVHSIVCQPYEHFQAPMFSETGYFMQNEQYILPHHFSPQAEDVQNNPRSDGGAYPRYHLYPQQHYIPERVMSNSTSPRSSPFQCDKCGAVYEDANQLGEHMRTNHLDSPSAYPPAPQYQPLGNSPQQQSQQLHPSSPLSNPQQQPSYDYNSGQTIKQDMKQEPEEQAEILDLDSHKVQTHRYEEELMRIQQQQQQQGLQMQMHHQQVMQQQQQRIGSHSVSSMIAWPPNVQTHDYHVGLPPMGTVDNVPPITDQNQFMRNQHMPVEHAHQGAPIIANAQSMPGHQIPGGFVQQSAKAPQLANQSWKSNEPRRPKTYNCTACNKWFTSSGHLKRHYNTTLHKNAVKNGKEPDPATLPISAHHHPARDNNGGPSTSGRGTGSTTRSPPELSSSRSPPNLMAGPSGEATGGLLHTATTLCSNSNSSNSSNNSDSSAAVLMQQQQQQQQQHAVHLPHSGIMPLGSPGAPLPRHHQQQMGSAPHQLILQQQQQQQQLHLPTGTPVQPMHHTTSHSSMPPLPLNSHMNCPSSIGPSILHPHPMSCPSGPVNPAMTSPTEMGGTTMPHQPYPNALPPRVTTTTLIQALLLDSINQEVTTPPTTIGNKKNEQHEMNALPGFGTIEQKILPSFSHLGATGFVVESEQTQNQTVNVGGLNAEEITPQETSYESSSTNYDPYSPSRYRSVSVGTSQSTDSMMDNIEDNPPDMYKYHVEHLDYETNNNLAKEDVDPNVGTQSSKKKERKAKADSNKEPQFTGCNFISRDGFHKCIDCNKVFNKACYLTQHNKSFHSGDKPFKCVQCGKRFHNEELHGKHILMHGLTRKHQCDACPKVFAHRTDLKRHQCIHTGKRPFKCEKCGKGFIRQDHMKKHRETHNKKSRINGQRLQRQLTANRTSSQQLDLMKNL